MNQKSCDALVAHGITSESRVAFVRNGQIVGKCKHPWIMVMKSPDRDYNICALCDAVIKENEIG